MGHVDIQTTMRYLHHKSRADDAKLLSAAFRPKKRKPAAKRSTAVSPRKRAAPGEEVWVAITTQAADGRFVEERLRYVLFGLVLGAG